jgi:hypothetical protein
VPDSPSPTGYRDASSEDLSRFTEANSKGSQVRAGRLEFEILRNRDGYCGHILIAAKNGDEVPSARSAFGTFCD